MELWGQSISRCSLGIRLKEPCVINSILWDAGATCAWHPLGQKRGRLPLSGLWLYLSHLHPQGTCSTLPCLSQKPSPPRPSLFSESFLLEILLSLELWRKHDSKDSTAPPPASAFKEAAGTRVPHRSRQCALQGTSGFTA